MWRQGCAITGTKFARSEESGQSCNTIRISGGSSCSEKEVLKSLCPQRTGCDPEFRLNQFKQPIVGSSIRIILWAVFSFCGFPTMDFGCHISSEQGKIQLQTLPGHNAKEELVGPTMGFHFFICRHHAFVDLDGSRSRDHF